MYMVLPATCAFSWDAGKQPVCGQSRGPRRATGMVLFPSIAWSAGAGAARAAAAPHPRAAVRRMTPHVPGQPAHRSQKAYGPREQMSRSSSVDQCCARNMRVKVPPTSTVSGGGHALPAGTSEPAKSTVRRVLAALAAHLRRLNFPPQPTRTLTCSGKHVCRLSRCAAVVSAAGHACEMLSALQPSYPLL